MRRRIDFGASGQAIKAAAGIVLLGWALGACAPVVQTHGYLPKSETIDSLKEGSHSQREVRRLMGSPSTTATFGDETWYYINSLHHTYAWKPPVVVYRQILAVSFDAETKMVSDVRKYSVEDGRLIAFNADTTPTKGRELTFLEQLLGNVGRVSTEQFEEGADR